MAELGSQPARRQELSRLMLEKARQDLRAVVHLRTEASIADETVGFHVQQTIEKAIKAVLIRHGLEYDFTHDLAALFRQAEATGLSAPARVEDIAALTPFAVQFRYAILDDIDEFDREAGALLAETFLAWAHNIVEAPVNS